MAGAVVSRPAGGINNTAYLFFVLVLAFLFYVTLRGDLGKWLGLLGLSRTAAPAPQGAAGTPSLGGGLPGLPAIGSTVSPLPNTNATIYDPFGNPTGYGNPNYAGALDQNVDTSNFSGQGALYSNYAGPTFIDVTSGL